MVVINYMQKIFTKRCIKDVLDKDKGMIDISKDRKV